MHFPTWIDLKGQDSVPETVHHVVSIHRKHVLVVLNQILQHYKTKYFFKYVYVKNPDKNLTYLKTTIHVVSMKSFFKMY